jgi:hypothetical protein
MREQQLIAIVSAILFHVRDTNPPHGVYESQENAMKRACDNAKQLIRAAEQA